jgi:hypothetical protein
VGQLLLLPTDLAAAAVAASGAAVAAALAGLPVSGAKAAAGAAKRLGDEQFELYLEVSPAARHSRLLSLQDGACACWILLSSDLVSPCAIGCLQLEECRVQHSKATIDLLRTAQDALKGSGA